MPPVARPDDGPDGPFLRAAAWAWVWRSFDIGLPDAQEPSEATVPPLPTGPGTPAPPAEPGASALPAGSDTPAPPAPLPAAAVRPCPVRGRPRPARRRRGCRPGTEPRG